jgi:hypothetical protein
MSFIIQPDFFRRASEMRSEFEALVGPARSASWSRFCWDYWYVPNQFAYLRTFARNVFSRELYREFATILRLWGLEKLGSAGWTEPWLSYYIDGCGQQFHSDLLHGPWAWVYSLTRWDCRRFSGGETVLISGRILDYWRKFDPGKPAEVNDILTSIPAEFNQLLVFDGRVPHAVAAVEGAHDPLASRVVLHGWFLPPVARADGALPFPQAEPVLRAITDSWSVQRKEFNRINGLVVFRAHVGANGSIEDVQLVANTLASLDGVVEACTRVQALAHALVSSSHFPKSTGATTITIPFIAGDR